ncbi:MULTISPECIES: hypothetical protein [unclassified Streptomyces]|nr:MULTISPECIES: hypothetical protein [unclassified Streptomyces]
MVDGGDLERVDPGALGIALLFWCRARVAGDAPGGLADHLPAAGPR